MTVFKVWFWRKECASADNTMAGFSPFPTLAQALAAQIHNTSGCPGGRICFFLLVIEHGSAPESSLQVHVTQRGHWGCLRGFGSVQFISSLAVVGFSCLLRPGSAEQFPLQGKGQGRLFALGRSGYRPQPASLLWAVRTCGSALVTADGGAERCPELGKILLCSSDQRREFLKVSWALWEFLTLEGARLALQRA